MLSKLNITVPSVPPITSDSFKALEKEIMFMYGQAYRATPSLRNRLYGMPMKQLLKTAGPELAALIEDETEHRKVAIRSAWSDVADMFSITCVCASCEKVFRLNVAARDIAKYGIHSTQTYEEGARLWVIDELAAFYMLIAVEPCYGAREQALLAEWLTQRLAKAGERGMPYAQLIHEATQARMVPPRDADWMLRKLEFVEKWVPLQNSGLILPGGWDGEWTLPILTLPKDHPLRDW
jgi:hypothetical protein